MDYPKTTFVISSWDELEDGLSQRVVGVAFTEETVRRACETYGRLRAIEDLADDQDDEQTPVVWSEKDVDGRVALLYGDSGLALCFYQEVAPLAEVAG